MDQWATQYASHIISAMANKQQTPFAPGLQPREAVLTFPKETVLSSPDGTVSATVLQPAPIKLSTGNIVDTGTALPAQERQEDTKTDAEPEPPKEDGGSAPPGASIAPDANMGGEILPAPLQSTELQEAASLARQGKNEEKNEVQQEGLRDHRHR